MRARTAAALALALAARLVSACTDEAPAPPPDDASDGGAARPSADGGPPTSDDADTSGPRAPTGCLLSTTGYAPGTRAESVARTDVSNAAAWTGASEAIAPDGEFATVTLADGQESATLRVSGFGFAVPDTAETWGIEVELKRQAPDGGVQDQQINVEIERKASRYKFVNGDWPTSIVGTHAYGQAVDTWGVDLFPADVNKASFAATLTVKRAPGAVGPVTARVDSLRAAVHYCKDPVKR